MTTQLLKSKKKPAHKRGSNGRASHARRADIVINDSVHIPPWLTDHDSFRHWAFSDDFPNRGRFSFVAGKLWVDLSMETDIHNQIKMIITIVVGSLVLKEALGRFYVDGMLLTHPAIGLSNEPDGMFVSNEAMQSGRVELLKGDRSLELRGSADMVLEVVSPSSVVKDTDILVDQYARANIAEYWLVDSTIDAPELIIQRLVAGKYVTARKHDGWVKSHVFGRSFRLTGKKDAMAMTHFNLETK